MENVIDKVVFFTAFFSLFFFGTSSAQINWCDENGINPATGKPCVNTIVTAMPFLRIVPDARSAGMGDAGITTSADANALHFNSSKLAFAENRFGFSATYTPWLRALGVRNIYLLYLTDYVRLDDKQTIGVGFRYFNLGNIGNSSPYELSAALSYNRKLSQKFAAGLTMKYIYSNLALLEDQPGMFTVYDTWAIAGDLSFTYKTPLTDVLDLTLGGVVSNLGSKVKYADYSTIKDFLPANLGIGTGLTWEINELHSIHFALDINRLLAPTPPGGDPFGVENNNSGDPLIPDYKEQSTLAAALNSFSDAPGGFREEMRENNYSLGAEYRYKWLAARIGHFNEHRTKGNRKYMTLGVGANYDFATVNLSYLPALSKTRNPLDNTVRVSLVLDFGE